MISSSRWMSVTEWLSPAFRYKKTVWTGGPVWFTKATWTGKIWKGASTHSKTKYPLFIPEIRPRRENVGYACRFDLRVVGCKGLTVDFHPDDIYSRRSVPSYRVAVQIENANIPYATDSRKTSAAAVIALNAGMRPAGTRHGSITANPLDKENLLASAGYDDTLALSSGQDDNRAPDRRRRCAPAGFAGRPR